MEVVGVGSVAVRLKPLPSRQSLSHTSISRTFGTFQADSLSVCCCLSYLNYWH